MRYKSLFFVLFFVNTCLAAEVNSSDLPEDKEKKILDWVDYRYNVYKINVIKCFTGIDVTYERRVNVNFSLTGNLDWRGQKDRQSILLMPGIRYYYNLEKRILRNAEKNQLKTSCISADYFEFNFLLGSGYGKAYDEYNYRTNGGYVGTMLRAGRQRIFWKYCYYDIWLGYRVLYPDYISVEGPKERVGYGIGNIDQIKKSVSGGLTLGGALGIFLWK